MRTIVGLLVFGTATAIALSACSGGEAADEADPGAKEHAHGEEGDASSSATQPNSEGGTTPKTGPGSVTGLPCDVDAVLAKNCGQCHGATPAYGAPMPLVTHADLVAPASSDATKKVYEVVGIRTHDDAHPMPQAPLPRLSAKDQATLDAWIGARAPSSTVACGQTPGAGEGGPKALNCKPDTFVKAGAPFTMPSDVSDQYMCFGFDAKTTGKRHVTGFMPKIDNKKIVHHLLIYQSPESVSPTPTKCGVGGNSKWALVTGWAPGGEGFELPPEAGFASDPSGTTHWVMQVHYNNLKGLVGETDQSGYDLCTTDQLRPNDADTMAFGAINFSIPPHSALDTTCSHTWAQNRPKVTVIGASPHMHLLGKALESTLFPMGGAASKSIFSQPAFDFANGGGGFTPKVDISPGDVVKTRCKWNNTTDATVKFGEATTDEMCFGFMIYYPKVTTPGWKWMLPSVLSKCEPTP